MSRILVTYATKTGSTAEVAGILADELRLLGHEVDLSPASSAPSPGGYALVVLGSGVWMRRLYGELLDYIEEHEPALVTAPVAVFDVSLAPVVDPEHGCAHSHHAIERLEERFPAMRPAATAAFAGAFRTEGLSAGEEELVRLMGAEEGDYVDEAEVRRWADTLAAMLPVPQPVRS